MRCQVHSKGPLLYHPMKKLHATLRVIEEVFGHPVDVNLGDEVIQSTNLHGCKRRRDALEVFFREFQLRPNPRRFLDVLPGQPAVRLLVTDNAEIIVVRS